ncbi:hypothetical protein GYMLUDRAFT_71284 [Collybiopsis luxurians FD-317 M1]|nr:hypothetical protein GYMLUDRAFT_71284 [Collybiopsis luxurians FD-317 M1]
MDILTKWFPDYEHVFIYDNATTHLKCPSKSFGVNVTEWDLNGMPMYRSDGKLSKVKVQMGPGKFADSQPQDLYYPDDHPTFPRYFKGIEAILAEQGIDASKEKPDFIKVESLLEAECQSRGFQVVFPPKFHFYHFYPESKKEDDLRRNALESLNQVPLLSIQHFVTHTHQFMDAYSKGLSGQQAAWATCKYQGHHILPEKIMEELLDEDIT